MRSLVAALLVVALALAGWSGARGATCPRRHDGTAHALRAMTPDAAVTAAEAHSHESGALGGLAAAAPACGTGLALVALRPAAVPVALSRDAPRAAPATLATSHDPPPPTRPPRAS